MAEVESAVDAKEWHRTFDSRAFEDGEVEAAGSDCFLSQRRGFSLLAAKGEEAFARGTMVGFGHWSKLMKQSAVSAKWPCRVMNI